MLSMKYSYYPGCTLRNKAKDLDEYARASARALGFELEEIEDWQCCGGVYPLGLGQRKMPGSGNSLLCLSSCDQTCQ